MKQEQVSPRERERGRERTVREYCKKWYCLSRSGGTDNFNADEEDFYSVLLPRGDDDLRSAASVASVSRERERE